MATIPTTSFPFEKFANCLLVHKVYVLKFTLEIAISLSGQQKFASQEIHNFTFSKSVSFIAPTSKAVTSSFPPSSLDILVAKTWQSFICHIIKQSHNYL